MQSLLRVLYAVVQFGFRWCLLDNILLKSFSLIMAGCMKSEAK